MRKLGASRIFQGIKRSSSQPGLLTRIRDSAWKPAERLVGGNSPRPRGLTGGSVAEEDDASPASVEGAKPNARSSHTNINPSPIGVLPAAEDRSTAENSEPTPSPPHPSQTLGGQAAEAGPVAGAGALLILAGLLVFFAVNSGYWRSWPIALLVAALVVLTGVSWRLWAYQKSAASNSSLGAALLGGLVVGVAVLVLQLTFQDRTDRTAEKRNLQLSLGFQHDLSGMDLRGRDLSWFYLRRKKLDEATLTGADLHNSDLEFATLTSSHLDAANLVSADLTQADLTDAVLSGANLAGADLTDAKLTNVDLSGSNLSHATLVYAKGTGVKLNGSNLAYANLALTILRGAIIEKANLSDTDLSGANLSYAHLEGADLKRATLENVNLRHATYDKATRWPAGFDPESSGAINSQDAS